MEMPGFRRAPTRAEDCLERSNKEGRVGEQLMLKNHFLPPTMCINGARKNKLRSSRFHTKKTAKRQINYLFVSVKTKNFSCVVFYQFKCNNLSNLIFLIIQ